MMGSLGAGQGNTESIAQFIQRLSQTSNLFTPGTGDAVGQFLCFIGSTQVAFDVHVLTHCLCLFGRVLWRSAVSGVSEFLNGRHGSAATW